MPSFIEERIKSYNHLAKIYREQQNPRSREMKYMADCLDKKGANNMHQTITAEKDCHDKMVTAKKRGNL